MNTADTVLYIFDVNEETNESLTQQQALFEKATIKYLLVGNKADTSTEASRTAFTSQPNIHFISAKQKSGIPELKAALFNQTVQSSLDSESTIITNARHFEALQQVQQSLADIINGLNIHLSGDLLALDIRRCLYYLGEITGEITNEDKLDYIFSKFCIGK